MFSMVGSRVVRKRRGSKDVVTVDQLPPATRMNTGWSYMVTDSSVTTFWNVVAGGGANTVPVTSDGINWRVG